MYGFQNSFYQRNNFINSIINVQAQLAPRYTYEYPNYDNAASTTKSTNKLLNSIMNSDEDKNGSVSQEELTSKIDACQKKIEELEVLKEHFKDSPYMIKSFDLQIEKQQKDLESHQHIQTNFDAFSGHGSKDGIDDQDITKFYETAGYDKAYLDFTEEELSYLRISSMSEGEGEISEDELTSFVTNDLKLGDNEDTSLTNSLVDSLIDEISDNGSITREELKAYIDTNGDGTLQQSEIVGFSEGLKDNLSSMNNLFSKINSDENGNISKEELKAYMQENQGLKEDSNTNLTDYILDNIINEISEDKVIEKQELLDFVDTNNNGKLEDEEVESFNNNLQENSNILNNAEVWQGQGQQNTNGYIDWNKDGKFNNEINHNNSYIAVHGDMDQFFKEFGYNWSGYQLTNLESIHNQKDNSAKDTDIREDFVSNGKVTSHKISDTQIGFNVTSHDQSKAAGVDYDYAVWDKEKMAFIIGQDKDNDGNLKGDEIQGIVDNVGTRTSSPLVFDLNNDGKVETTDIQKTFDINGDGKVDQTAWAGVNDGVLAFDADGDGKVGEDGKELFGNNTDVDGNGKADGFDNGFEALRGLAKEFLGVESVEDNKLDASEIQELERKADLSMIVGNTKKSLFDLGITEISLGFEEVDVNESKDENGNEHRQVGEGFVINGQKAKVNDVWFKYQ